MTTSTQKRSVHILGPEFSNFVRSVMLICEENNIGYSTGFNVKGKKVDFKSEEHFKLHPYGKLPVLIDNDVIIPETASICRYLLANFPCRQTVEKNQADIARQDSFCAIASIYIDKAILRDYLLEFVFPKGENGEVRLNVVKEAQVEVHKALTVIEQTLHNEDILGAEILSIADALVAPMLHYITTLPAEFNVLPAYEKTSNYLAKLMLRPSCKKILVAKQD